MNWEKTSDKHKDGKFRLGYFGKGVYKVVDFSMGKWWAESDYEVRPPDFVCELTIPEY